MKFFFLNIIAVFSLFLFASNARAELFLEPYGAFNFGKFGEHADTVTGTGWGGRLGYINTGFHFGLDYMESKMSVHSSRKDDDDGDGTIDTTKDEGEKMSDAKLTMKEYAAFVGINLPAFLRFYGGYIFSAQGNIPKIQYQFGEGHGSKFGISFTSIPFVNINFEYRNIHFGKVTDSHDDAKSRLGDSFEAYAVTLSIPLSI